MRIQILRLPEVVAGDDVQTPFALVVDQAGTATVGDLGQFRDECGARAVLVTEHTMQVVSEFAEPTSEPEDRPEPAPDRVHIDLGADDPPPADRWIFVVFTWGPDGEHREVHGPVEARDDMGQEQEIRDIMDAWTAEHPERMKDAVASLYLTRQLNCPAVGR